MSIGNWFNRNSERREDLSPPSQNFVVDEKKPSPVAIIYRSEFDYISRCILDYPNIETGGELYGFWSNNGIPVVLFVIGPGPYANHEGAFFNQDIDYMVKVGDFVRNKFGLQHIGAWHSHHKIGLAHPSGHDAQTAVHSMQSHSMRRLLMCIGNCDDYSSTLNAYMFHENTQYDYIHAAWSIKEICSPYRSIIEEDLKLLLIHPQTKKANHKAIFQIPTPSENEKIEFPNNYWLKEKRNHVVLKRISDYLKTIHQESAVTIGVDNNQLVHVNIVSDRAGEDILFPEGFPMVPPLFTNTGLENVNQRTKDVFFSEYSGSSGQGKPTWNYNGDIYISFVSYYNQIKKL